VNRKQRRSQAHHTRLALSEARRRLQKKLRKKYQTDPEFRAKVDKEWAEMHGQQ
jgi:hypothetical protein